MNRAYELAKAEVGTLEWKDGHNPKVLAYFRDVGHAWVKDDETAWCAAFVGAMLERSGLPGTGKLTARSYLEWGEPVPIEDAREGDLAIFKRGNSSWQGHVAFFVKENPTTISVLGGNQANAVNIRNYSKGSLLGIRRAPPWGEPGSLPDAEAWDARDFSALDGWNLPDPPAPAPRPAQAPEPDPRGFWARLFGWGRG